MPPLSTHTRTHTPPPPLDRGKFSLDLSATKRVAMANTDALGISHGVHAKDEYFCFAPLHTIEQSSGKSCPGAPGGGGGILHHSRYNLPLSTISRTPPPLNASSNSPLPHPIHLATQRVQGSFEADGQNIHDAIHAIAHRRFCRWTGRRTWTLPEYQRAVQKKRARTHRHGEQDLGESRHGK